MLINTLLRFLIAAVVSCAPQTPFLIIKIPILLDNQQDSAMTLQKPKEIEYRFGKGQ